jgi:hypothetical protein
VIAASVCAVASLGALRTESLVPDRFRRIPRTEAAPPVLDIAAAS